ncbi:hypothetical protein DV735_g1868, partial [Chaetothyriales sp. CBS 134920]
MDADNMEIEDKGITWENVEVSNPVQGQTMTGLGELAMEEAPPIQRETVTIPYSPAYERRNDAYNQAAISSSQQAEAVSQLQNIPYEPAAEQQPQPQIFPHGQQQAQQEALPQPQVQAETQPQLDPLIDPRLQAEQGGYAPADQQPGGYAPTQQQPGGYAPAQQQLPHQGPSFEDSMKIHKRYEPWIADIRARWRELGHDRFRDQDLVWSAGNRIQEVEDDIRDQRFRNVQDLEGAIKIAEDALMVGFNAAMEARAAVRRAAGPESQPGQHQLDEFTYRAHDRDQRLDERQELDFNRLTGESKYYFELEERWDEWAEKWDKRLEALFKETLGTEREVQVRNLINSVEDMEAEVPRPPAPTPGRNSAPSAQNIHAAQSRLNGQLQAFSQLLYTEEYMAPAKGAEMLRYYLKYIKVPLAELAKYINSLPELMAHMHLVQDKSLPLHAAVELAENILNQLDRFLNRAKKAGGWSSTDEIKEELSMAVRALRDQIIKMAPLGQQK